MSGAKRSIGTIERLSARLNKNGPARAGPFLFL